MKNNMKQIAKTFLILFLISGVAWAGNCTGFRAILGLCNAQPPEPQAKPKESVQCKWIDRIKGDWFIPMNGEFMSVDIGMKKPECNGTRECSDISLNDPEWHGKVRMSDGSFLRVEDANESEIVECLVVKGGNYIECGVFRLLRPSGIKE